MGRSSSLTSSSVLLFYHNFVAAAAFGMNEALMNYECMNVFGRKLKQNMFTDGLKVENIIGLTNIILVTSKIKFYLEYYYNIGNVSIQDIRNNLKMDIKKWIKIK